MSQEENLDRFEDILEGTPASEYYGRRDPNKYFDWTYGHFYRDGIFIGAVVEEGNERGVAFCKEEKALWDAAAAFVKYVGSLLVF
ncbi:hypothetical protein ACLMJK_006316 [Lecanora helva]